MKAKAVLSELVRIKDQVKLVSKIVVVANKNQHRTIFEPGLPQKKRGWDWAYH
jgi:hypothetical protein